MQHDPQGGHRIALHHFGIDQGRAFFRCRPIGVAHDADRLIELGTIGSRCILAPGEKAGEEQQKDGELPFVREASSVHVADMNRKRIWRQWTLCGTLGLLLSGIVGAEEIFETELADFTLVPVAEGLERPWSMLELPDGQFLIAERPGRLRLVDAEGRLQEKPIEGLPEVYPRGQGGLLDVVLHPDYKENGWIYLSYSAPGGDGGLTQIMRAKLEGNALVDQEVIFEADASQYTNKPFHFGCRLEFDDENYLFFCIGDRGVMENSQDLSNVKGKIHRIHDDGSVPEDNPFVKDPEAEPTIWAFGSRNAQGLAIDPKTGALWETEHGPKGGDELNLIEKGANYGWPVITYGINYNGDLITEKREAEGMEQPVLQWTPSIAVCGIEFYEGDVYPEWDGDLLVTSLAHQKLIRLGLKNNQVWVEEILLKNKGRIRDVFVSDAGEIYLVFDQPGQVMRLERVDADS